MHEVLIALTLCGAPYAQLVWSEQDPEDSSARVRRLGATGPATLASLPVLPGFEPVGRVSPDGRRAVAVTRESGRSVVASGRAWEVELATGQARTIATGVSGIDAPTFAPDGSVFLLRVVGAEEPTLDEQRAGRFVRLRYLLERYAGGAWSQFDAFPEPLVGLTLVAATGTELLAWRVADDAASIVAIPLDGKGSLRTVARLAEGALARDFSLTGSELVLATYDPPSGRHVVDAVNVYRGTRRRVLVSPHDHPSPLGTPLGLATCDADGSLAVGGAVRMHTGGIVVPLAASSDGQIAVRVVSVKNHLAVWSRAGSTAVSTAAYATPWGFARGTP